MLSSQACTPGVTRSPAAARRSRTQWSAVPPAAALMSGRSFAGIVNEYSYSSQPNGGLRSCPLKTRAPLLLRSAQICGHHCRTGQPSHQPVTVGVLLPDDERQTGTSWSEVDRAVSAGSGSVSDDMCCPSLSSSSHGVSRTLATENLRVSIPEAPQLSGSVAESCMTRPTLMSRWACDVVRSEMVEELAHRPACGSGAQVGANATTTS